MKSEVKKVRIAMHRLLVGWSVVESASTGTETTGTYQHACMHELMAVRWQERAVAWLILRVS